MMKMLVAVAALITLAAFPQVARADLDRWTSVRALGMGNAYTAVVSDTDALFYNPAALCRVDSLQWTILDPRVGVDSLKAVDEYKQIQQADKSTTDMANYLNTLYGKHYWGEFGAKSAVAVPCFGAGVYGATQFQASMSNPTYPTLNLQYYVDYGGVVGGAIPLDPYDIMTLGLAASRIYRTGTATPVQASQLSSLNSTTIIDDMKNAGVANGLDAGLNITLPVPSHLTFSAVYRNIGTTSFSHTGGTQAPSSIPSELIAGTSLEFDLPGLSITPAVDIRDVLGTETFAKKLNAGIEVSLPIIDVRAGVSSGYFSFGAGVNLGLIRLDAVTYAEELGVYPGQDEDRRYMLQMTVQLDFPIFRRSHGSSYESESGENDDSSSDSSYHYKERR